MVAGCYLRANGQDPRLEARKVQARKSAFRERPGNILGNKTGG